MKKYTNKKIVAVLVIFCLAICGIISYNAYSDYESIKYNININQENTKDQLDSYIKTTLCDANDYLKVILKNKTEVLQENIISDYKNNHSLLENDIINPATDSLLTKNIINQLDNKGKDKLFIANYDNIIWTTSGGKNTEDLLVWEDIIKLEPNRALNEESINIIKKGDLQNIDIIFCQQGFSNLTVNSIDIDKFISELRKHDYDINQLKSFDILIPVYITEDGDIFGIKDINSLGQYNKNYKLYVIERVNMYSVLESHMINIEQYKYDIDYGNTTLRYVEKGKVSLLVGLIILISSVIIVSAILQNKK